MDRWAWEQLHPWLELRATLPVGSLFCVLRGPTRGRTCSAAGIRVQLHAAAHAAGVRRRVAPHQLRHAHAVEMSREGVPLLVIQRQLGHADLGITSVYLRGIDNTEIVHPVHERPAPMIFGVAACVAEGSSGGPGSGGPAPIDAERRAVLGGRSRRRSANGARGLGATRPSCGPRR